MRIPALSLRHVPQVAFWGFLFLLLLYLPLRGVDLWHHVNWGEWILEHGALPTEAPAMPLAEGMEITDTAWLSQVILAATERGGGAEWLSRLAALTGILTYLLLARALYLRTRSSVVVTLGVLAAFTLTWGRSTNFSADGFGALCFVALLWLLAGAAAPAAPAALGGEAEGEAAAGAGGAARGRAGSGGRRLALWIGVPLLLALWANLHGSFVYGLAVLACCCAGRAIDVGWRQGARAVLGDRSFRRRLVLLELGAAATLVNPYGIDLPLYALGLSPAVLPVEAQPLVLGGLSGLSFALSAVVLVFVLRHSRRPMPAAEVLLLGFFAAAGVTASSRLSWYGPVFVVILAPHVGELLARRRASRPRPLPEPEPAESGLGLTTGPDWHYTVIGMTLLAVVFVLSPLSSSLLGRAPRTSGQLLGPEAPLALIGYLTANPPQGQVFNPVQWGGLLALEGPPGLELFVTPEPQVTPRRVLQDYLRVVAASADWQRTMDRYRIDTMIVDRVQQPTLLALLRSATSDWRPVYEDPVAAVYARIAESHDHGDPQADEQPAAAPPAAELGP